MRTERSGRDSEPAVRKDPAKNRMQMTVRDLISKIQMFTQSSWSYAVLHAATVNLSPFLYQMEIQERRCCMILGSAV